MTTDPNKLGFFGVEELRTELLLENGILRSSFCDCHGEKLPQPSEFINNQDEAITVRCIENLELWVNHIATANGRRGELYLRGTKEDFGSNYAQFFRKKKETKEEMRMRRAAMLENMMQKDKILVGLFENSNDTNETPLGSRSRITEFSQRLAILQHYEQIPSIGLDATKDAKVAAAFAFSNYADKAVQSKSREKDAFIYGIFISGELKMIDRKEPRIRFADELQDDHFVLMDLGAFLPATAKRPRLQKGHMIYRASDLVALKKLCVPTDDKKGKQPANGKPEYFKRVTPGLDEDEVLTDEETEDPPKELLSLPRGVRVHKSEDSALSLSLCPNCNVTHDAGGIDHPDAAAIYTPEQPLSQEDYRHHLLNDGGWDANGFCIVKFRIPSQISYTRFFECHTDHPMSMERLLRHDHLKERLENEIKLQSSERMQVDVLGDPAVPPVGGQVREVSEESMAMLQSPKSSKRSRHD